MFSQQNHISTGSFAHKGNYLSALFVNSMSSKPWIVDSGASDHMTRDASLFQHYSPCREGLTVKIANGSLSKVAGTGSIILSVDLTIQSVHHVPNLDCNLLLVSKLSRDLNCVAKFFSNLCEF